MQIRFCIFPNKILGQKNENRYPFVDWIILSRGAAAAVIPIWFQDSTVSHRVPTVSHRLLSRCIRFHGIPPTSHGIPHSSHGILRPTQFHGIPPTCHGVPQYPTDLPQYPTVYTVSHRLPTVSHGMPPNCHGIPPNSHGIPRYPAVSWCIPRYPIDFPRYPTELPRHLPPTCLAISRCLTFPRNPTVSQRIATVLHGIVPISHCIPSYTIVSRCISRYPTDFRRFWFWFPLLLFRGI